MDHEFVRILSFDRHVDELSELFNQKVTSVHEVVRIITQSLAAYNLVVELCNLTRIVVDLAYGSVYVLVDLVSDGSE